MRTDGNQNGINRENRNSGGSVLLSKGGSILVSVEDAGQNCEMSRRRHGEIAFGTEFRVVDTVSFHDLILDLAHIAPPRSQIQFNRAGIRVSLPLSRLPR